MATLWCEARCDGLYDDDNRGCHETAEGAFGAREAAKVARRYGWKVLNDEWLCPVCYSRRKQLTADY